MNITTWIKNYNRYNLIKLNSPTTNGQKLTFLISIKRPLWNNHAQNAAWKILYYHVQINDYVGLTTNTPTRFSSSSKYTPDVLDIGLISK